MKDTIYFISDAHFGIHLQGQECREEYFYSFIESVKRRMSTLYILGDFFDFWIEYKTVIRFDYFRLLCALRNIADSGVEVHYLAGNHDFALGPFFKKQLGITVHHNTLRVQLQGKKVFMYHGDGLIKNDRGYRVLKKILRNSFNQKLYKLLHPDFGIWLGTFSSGESRKTSKHRLTEQRIKEYRHCAHKELQRGNDIVLYGHSHYAEIIGFPEGIYCNTGSWLGNYSFATLHNSEIHLYRYQPGRSPEEVPLVVIK